MELEAIALGVGIFLLSIIVLIGVGLEWRYRRRPSQPLEILPAQWEIDIYEPGHYRLTGELGLSNPHRGLEVMVPDLSAQVRLLSKDDISAIDTVIDVIPRHPEPECAPRGDRYWFAYIVKSNKQTAVELILDINGPNLTALKAAWVQINYIVYGPHGRQAKTHHEIIPLSFPSESASSQWRGAENCDVLPIHTHLLTPLDSAPEIVKRYVLPHSLPGDIVTIGETPLAIMQSRWLDPAQLEPGWVARRVCQFFLPTSSLATACGMQALVEQVGAFRVLLAFLGGSLGKVFGYKGGFYQLAGYQARLIDDVTGTLPPYDQFIVLGPDHPQGVVEEIKTTTGLEAAIVDVNDLGAVKVLAATSGAKLAILEQALRKNPAGNADEQTPVVLIRPQEI